jgi:hypothetical protein
MCTILVIDDEKGILSVIKRDQGDANKIRS